MHTKNNQNFGHAKTQKKTVTHLTLKIWTSYYNFSSKFLYLKQVKSIDSLSNRILGLQKKLFFDKIHVNRITTFEEHKPGTREFGRFRSIVY